MQNFKFFVGIDVSKDSFSVCAISSPESVLFEDSFPMSTSGFNSFIKRLSQFPKNSVLIAKESSGCYFINLFAFLCEKNFQCVVLNPLIVNKFLASALRKTKTDRLDAKAIAITLYHIHHLLPKESFLQNEFRDIAREREKLSQQIARVKNDIEKLLSILFPELERKVNIYNASVLRLLEQFPSAHAIKYASIENINSALSMKGPGRQPNISPEEIKSLAKESIALHWPVKERILAHKIKELFFLQEQLEFFTNILKECCEQAAVCQDIKLIKSIKGIGDTTAMHFVAEAGCIKRFSNYKKLIAYSGLDPTVYESGKFKGKSRISKRGNRHLRRVVWLMTVGVVRHNEFFRNYFLIKKAKGIPFKKAMLVTAHKLLRVLWAILTKRQPFIINHFSYTCMKEVNFS